MYLIQVGYKNSKYGNHANQEVILIHTLHKCSYKKIKQLQIVLNEKYFDNSKTEMCLIVENKDELFLLLIDKFIRNFAGDCYSSKRGFETEISRCSGADLYLQSITHQLSSFNIDNVVIDKNLTDFFTENMDNLIVEDLLG